MTTSQEALDEAITLWVLLFRHEDFFTTGSYFERALQKSHNVVTVYVNRYGVSSILPPSLFSRLVAGLINRKTGGGISFDLVLVVDPVRIRLELKRFNAPTAYYAIDSHVALGDHIRRTKVADYEYVFVAQKDYLDRYVKAGCKKVIWLPLACDPEIHRPHKVSPIYDVAFIGDVPRGSRRDVVTKAVSERFCTFIGRRYLHDMAETFSQSRIALNISREQDLNQRVFEAMSCGPLLVTDKIQNGLDELFTDGEHLVVYRDDKDLFSKLEYYLSHDDERRQIATSGLLEVQKRHTVQHRIQTIMNTVLGAE